jgi:hypothetical protein
MLAHAGSAAASDWDLTLYGGLALPTYDQSFSFGLPGVSRPGIEVTPSGDLVLEAKGDLVFGGALAWEAAGFFGLEARFDTAKIAIESPGVRFDLVGNVPVIGPVPGSLTIGAGSIDLERLVVLSLNARLRTPGTVSLVASGGVSYLPKLEATGTLPLDFEVSGVPVLPNASGRLRLVALPTQSEHRFGVNGGAGIRIGFGGNVALMAEARAFAFKEYDLIFELATSPPVPFTDELIEAIGPIEFTPIYFQAGAGIVILF